METLIGSLEGNTERIAAQAGRDARVTPTLLGGYLEAAVAACRAGRRFRSAELQACRDRAEEAAERGVPLPALLDLYLSATWRLWGEVLDTLDAVTPPTVAAVAATLFRAADDAAAALAGGYQAAQRRAIRREEALRREFVDDLLGGRAESEALHERAARFGFNLAGDHRVAAGRTRRSLVDAGPIHSRVEAEVLARFGGRDVVVATKEGLLVCVFPPAADPVPDFGRLLEESGEGPWQVGVGRVHAGPGGVVRSLEEAREALDLATRLGITATVVPFEALLPYRLLAGDPRLLAEVVEAVLGPLRATRGGAGPLIDTLEAFFAASGNVSATARRLHLSPRAVSYRLDRIARLTGHAPTDPEDRFVLELAVRGRRLVGLGNP